MKYYNDRARELPGVVCNNYTAHGYYKLVIISDAYAMRPGLSVAICATWRFKTVHRFVRRVINGGISSELIAIYGSRISSISHDTRDQISTLLPAFLIYSWKLPITKYPNYILRYFLRAGVSNCKMRGNRGIFSNYRVDNIEGKFRYCKLLKHLNSVRYDDGIWNF